jgi:transposase
MEIQETLNNYEEASIDWHKYNLAKTQEKRLFYQLLHELCQIIPEVPNPATGRHPVQVRDLVFSAGLKLYSNYSGRKIMSDLVHAKGANFIKSAPHYNTLSDFINSEAVYDLLQRLLTISAMPLKLLEDSFSIDSSGFGSYQYERWMRTRFSGSKKGWRNYLKGHIVIGTRTNIICACECTYGNYSDVKQAPELIKRVGDNFNMKEFSGDKAYSAMRIHQLLESFNAIPYIVFKDNSNPKEHKSPRIWYLMYNYFKNHTEQFMKHYHKRSNVETVFSMVKMRLGEFLKSKTYVAQRNELLMKFICHNICCLVQEIFERHVTIDFKKCSEEFVDRKVVKSLGGASSSKVSNNKF